MLAVPVGFGRLASRSRWVITSQRRRSRPSADRSWGRRVSTTAAACSTSKAGSARVRATGETSAWPSVSASSRSARPSWVAAACSGCAAGGGSSGIRATRPVRSARATRARSGAVRTHHTRARQRTTPAADTSARAGSGSASNGIVTDPCWNRAPPTRPAAHSAAPRTVRAAGPTTLRSARRAPPGSTGPSGAISGVFTAASIVKAQGRGQLGVSSLLTGPGSGAVPRCFDRVNPRRDGAPRVPPRRPVRCDLRQAHDVTFVHLRDAGAAGRVSPSGA